MKKKKIRIKRILILIIILILIVIGIIFCFVKKDKKEIKTEAKNKDTKIVDNIKPEIKLNGEELITL